MALLTRAYPRCLCMDILQEIEEEVSHGKKR